MNCTLFDVCGGCTPMPYPEELERKEAHVRELLRPYSIDDWPPIVAAPEPWYYRNKMEYAFGVWDDRLALGLREGGEPVSWRMRFLQFQTTHCRQQRV